MVFRRDNLPIDWAPSADKSLTVRIPAPVLFNKVRVEIVAWHGRGGGLSEIQVLRRGNNIALGQPVTFSGFTDMKNYPAASLTDGVTTSSKKPWQGYWISPDGQAAWAEVSLTSQTRSSR